MRLRRDSLAVAAGALRRVRARYDIMCFNFQALRRVLRVRARDDIICVNKYYQGAPRCVV